MLVDMAAVGVLRSDLIGAVGARDARSIIARYGFACGSRMAVSEGAPFRDGKNEGSLFDRIAASLNSLDLEVRHKRFHEQGAAVHRIEIPHSLEAQQHGISFGRHNSPVCWFTVGFINGYAASCAPGNRLLYQEIRCSCAGAKREGLEACVFEGKERSVWGDGVPAFLSNLGEMRGVSGIYPLDDSLHRSRIDALIRSIAGVVSDSKETGDVLELAVRELSDEFGCTVAIEELGVITYSCVHSNDHGGNGAAIDVLNGLALRGSLSFSHATSYYESKRRSFFLADSVSGSTVNRLVCPLLANGRRRGYLSLIRVNFPFSSGDQELVERIADMFAKHIAEQRYVQELKGKLASAFIDDLVTGRHDRSNPALNYSKELGFDLSTPSRVVVVDIHDPMGKLPPAVGAFQADEWIQIAVGAASKFSMDGAKFLIVYRNKQMVTVVQGDDGVPLDFARAFAGGLKETLRQSFPSLRFTLGIGSICRSVDDFEKSFSSACRFIELGKNLGREGEILSSEQFNARTLLYGALDSAVMLDFASLRLKPLIDYDKENNGELLATLECYIENKGNSHRTAEMLSLSSSGLKYRLKNIEKVAGIDVRDTRTFFDIALAIDIMHEMGGQRSH